MRRREDCYLRSIWNGRDWQERKRPFSNSHQFKNFFSNSLILDKNLKLYRFQIKSLRLRIFAFIIKKTSNARCHLNPFRMLFSFFLKIFCQKTWQPTYAFCIFALENKWKFTNSYPFANIPPLLQTERHVFNQRPRAKTLSCIFHSYSLKLIKLKQVTFI